MLEKGAVFAEKYEILECLSSGTQASVYKAVQKPLDRPVILKILFPSLTTNAEVVSRFEREAKLLSNLKDEGVTKVYDFGKHNSTYFFVSEYIEGQSVKELLEHKGRLSAQFASYIVLEVAKILSRLHRQGIIHRDLKPGNILISPDGKVKLTDFGLAFSQAMPSITIQGSILGTPSYMPPEQILGKPVNFQSDIYSLGVVYYELLTGINPFLGDNYSAIMHNVLNLKPIPTYKIDKQLENTRDLWQMLEPMIDKSPSARFQEINEVCVKLDLWFNNPDNKKWKLDTKDWQSGENILTSVNLSRPKPKFKGIFLIPLAVILLLIAWRIGVGIRHISKPGARFDTTESYSIIKNDTLISVSQKPDQNIITGKTESTINREKELPNINKNTGGFLPDTGFSKIGKPGWLKVAATPWAKIFIDGKEVFTTPKDTTLELLSGQHNIKLINPNFPVLESIVTIESNKTLQFNIDLTKQVSYLQISVQPWADVYIDNIFKTTTPISSPLILPSGIHKITLKNPYFQVYEETITFEPKQTVERNITLK